MENITESTSKKEYTESSQEDSSTSDDDNDKIQQQMVTLKRKRAHNDTLIIGMEIDISKNRNTNLETQDSKIEINLLREGSKIINESPDVVQTNGEAGYSPRSNREMAIQVSSDEDLTAKEVDYPCPKRRKMSGDHFLSSSPEDNSVTMLDDVFEKLHYPNEDNNALQQAIDKLPIKSSMFHVPLDRDYSENDLVTAGAGSFSGTDKEIYKNVSNSTNDTSRWKLVIVQVGKVVKKSNNRSFISQESSSTKGKIKSIDFIIDGIYNEIGGKLVSSEYSWISGNTFDKCVAENGLILMQCQRDLEHFWGEGTKVTTAYDTLTFYTKTFLVVYTDSAALYHLMRLNDKRQNDHIPALISHVQQNSDQTIPKLFHILQTHSFDLNSSACSDLINLFRENSTKSRVSLSSVVEAILLNHNDSYDHVHQFCAKINPDCLTDALIGIIDQCGGWNNPSTLRIQRVLKDKLASNKAKSACELLQKIHLLLRMQRISGCKLHHQINNIVAAFEKETQSRTEFECESKFKCLDTTPSSPHDIRTEIVRIEQYHCWSDIKQAVNACFQRLEKESRSIYLLHGRAVALHEICFKAVDFDDYQLCDKVVEDITKKIEEIPTQKELKLKKEKGVYWIERSRRILKSEELGFLLKFVSIFGESKHFKRIQRWGGKATLEDLKILTNTFNMVAPDSTCTMWLNEMK